MQGVKREEEGDASVWVLIERAKEREKTSFAAIGKDTEKPSSPFSDGALHNSLSLSKTLIPLVGTKNILNREDFIPHSFHLTVDNLKQFV